MRLSAMNTSALVLSHQKVPTFAVVKRLATRGIAPADGLTQFKGTSVDRAQTACSIGAATCVLDLGNVSPAIAR